MPNRVVCEIQSADVAHPDTGEPTGGISATCSRCDTVSECIGTGDASVRRALALLRENCPKGQRNFYVSADDDD